jgi:hypothetical protein
LVPAAGDHNDRGHAFVFGEDGQEFVGPSVRKIEVQENAVEEPLLDSPNSLPSRADHLQFDLALR